MTSSPTLLQHASLPKNAEDLICGALVQEMSSIKPRAGVGAGAGGAMMETTMIQPSKGVVNSGHGSPLSSFNSDNNNKGGPITTTTGGGGGGGGKGRKRSRASNKTPITVLTADPSNFRDMVQQLTGIPGPSLIPNQREGGVGGGGGGGGGGIGSFPIWAANNNNTTSPYLTSILKPQPKRPNHQHGGFFPPLPTLDTSALYVTNPPNPNLNPTPSTLAPNVPTHLNQGVPLAWRDNLAQSMTWHDNSTAGGGGGGLLDGLLLEDMEQLQRMLLLGNNISTSSNDPSYGPRSSSSSSLPLPLPSPSSLYFNNSFNNNNFDSWFSDPSLVELTH